ncbi:MAG: cytochrome c3 family protein [Polyangiaceae bacterium]
MGTSGLIVLRSAPSLWVLLVGAVLLAASAAIAESPRTVRGLSPLPDGRAVPHAWLPAGADDPDPGPSAVVFPSQRIPLVFSHQRHLAPAVGATCRTCHEGAYRSDSVRDTLLPSGAVCDTCHRRVDHGRLADADNSGDGCAMCHRGYSPQNRTVVPPVDAPRANLVFSHRAHSARNIGCAQCHGAVERLDLATRDQLPRMRGCFRCHAMPDAASRGDAKSACDTCHPTVPGGRVQTMFASGALYPPAWMRDAEHTPDFLARHKRVAGDDSTFCASCHQDTFCTDCHDGRVRPRSVHPNDYLDMHPIEARMGTQRCQSCHLEQSFCLDCHIRAGVSEASPLNSRDSGRFHPPKSVWSDAPAGAGHHAFEAERGLSGCVSCHTERDCITCHGALGVGAGFNPHPPGFLGSCGREQRQNERPCLACHVPSDSALQRCR